MSLVYSIHYDIILLFPLWVCSIRDDVVPLALVQRLADELQQSSRAFHLELLPVGGWAVLEGYCRGQ